jgi:hypothetical protein
LPYEVCFRPGAWICGAFGGVEDFDADDATLVVVIDNDAVGDFLADLDRPSVSQLEVDRLRRVIDSHPHD